MKRLLLAILFLSFCSIASLQSEAAVFHQFFNITGDIVSHSGSNGATYVFKPNFFFNTNMNRTTLEYLGATQVIVNMTVKPERARGACAGACSITQEGGFYIPPANSYLSFLDNGADTLTADCGDNITVQSTGAWSNAWYVYSQIFNYTVTKTNVTTELVGGGQKVISTCLGILSSHNNNNITFAAEVLASGISASGSGFSVANFSAYADFDQNYGNNGTPYSNFVSDSYIPNANAIPINFTAPIMVNATYKLNNDTTTTLCSNCFNLSTTISGGKNGYNNVTMNFTFIKNGTTFSLYQTHSFLAGNVYEACEDGVSGVNQQVFNVTFLDEAAPTTQVTSNISLNFYDTTGSTIYTTSRVNKNFFAVCSISQILPQDIAFILTYKSANGLYPERVLRTPSSSTININITNPYITNAYLLSSATGTTITITVEDSLGTVQTGLIVEAYRYQPANNTVILVDVDSTDLNGIVQFLLELNQQYKFVVKDSAGNILKDTGVFIISETAYTITLGSVQEQIIHSMISGYAIQFNLTCNGRLFCNRSTSTFVNATWLAEAGKISQACIDVFNVTNAFNVNRINTTCVAQDSGEIIYNFAGFAIENKTKLSVVFYVTILNSSFIEPFNLTLGTIDVDLFAEYLLWGAFGLFIALFLILTVFGFIVPHSPTMTVLSMMFGVFLIYLTGITAMTFLIAMGLIWIGVFILFFMREAQ